MSLKKRLEESPLEKKNTRVIEKERDPYTEIKMKIQAQVIQDLDIDFNEISDQNESLKQELRVIIGKNIEKESLNITPAQKKRILEELLDEIIGFGPITTLLQDSDVTEIMVCLLYTSPSPRD